jgi:HEAT repeat protein
MDSTSPFITHFARLVWLIAQRPDRVEEQKEELRRALPQASSGPQVVDLHDVSVAVSSAVTQDEPDESLIWLSELSIRMTSHSVRSLSFDTAPPAREVMDVARVLAGMPRPGDDGQAFDEAFVGLSLTSVSAKLGPMGFFRRSTRNGQEPDSFETPATPMTLISGDYEAWFHDRPTPVAARAVQRSDDDARLMQDQLMPLAAPAEGASELVHRLDEAASLPNANMLVDDVSRAMEDRARLGHWHDLVEVLGRMYDYHDRLHDGDTRRAFLVGARRLEKPALMLGLAGLLPKEKKLKEPITRILARAGEVGADALIENLINSDVVAERRAYRDALRQCPAAAGALAHLLDDERWYVVRNAAELLGELAPTDADQHLAPLLSHREPRVRRAVAVALGKLGTSRAVLALLQRVNDGSPEVRVQVVHALASSRNERAVPWLIEALDSEVDQDVQAALIAALGQVPTEDAVARLARAAESGGLLLRKPAVMRLRAIDALADAGTPAALETLRGLLQDRDRSVREAAQKAISRATPRAEGERVRG